MSGGNYFRGKFYGEGGGGAIFPRKISAGTSAGGGFFLEGNCAGSNCPRLIFLGGNYPRG